MNIQTTKFTIAPQREASDDTEFLCWSRMQAEAGQAISKIVFRKELERRSGDGIFFWGVGNAPAKMARSLAKLHHPVPVVFSLMKSKPKVGDVKPNTLAVWRTYIDRDGIKRELPEHVLVTSKGDTSKGYKTAHYALVCHSDNPIRVTYGEAFDHTAYRNAGESGKPVGASQVTALLQRAHTSCGDADYEANIKASLFGSYWVRLEDPILIDAMLLERLLADFDTDVEVSANKWCRFVAQIRNVPLAKGSVSAERSIAAKNLDGQMDLLTGQ